MVATTIGPGDALRALAALSPTDASTRAAIFRLLGVARPTFVAEQPAPTTTVGRTEEVEPSRPRRSRLPIPTSRRERTRSKPRRRRRARATQLDPLPEERVKSGLGSMIEGLESLPPLGPPPGPPKLDSIPALFAPTWCRATLLSLVSTLVTARELDVAELVDRASQLRPMSPAPYRSILRPAPRVCVLWDMGPDMVPYRLEQRRITRDLEKLLGPKGLVRRLFWGDPWTGIKTPADADHEVVLRGSLVLATTWLGDDGRAMEPGPQVRWGRFARYLARNGSNLVLLTPRYGSVLASYRRARIPVVPWDRSTSPSDVDAARRRSR